MSKHDPKVTLEQIREFVAETSGYLRGETLTSLLSNRMKLRAFERVMQCIGEAVKRLPMSLREEYPEVDWRSAAGLRDWVAHDYDGLNYQMMWSAADRQLPGLQKTVEKMLADLAKRSADEGGA